ANSLSSRAPTMRPLPLSVWNERRTVMSASRSRGFWSQTEKKCWIRASSSCASSMKSFISSGSAGSAGAAPLFEGASVGAAASTASASGRLPGGGERLGICTVRARAADSSGSTVGTPGVGCCSRACTHAWALSSMYQGSERPACSQRAADALGDGVLDAREVHDALAQHRRLHLLEFGVLGRPRELRVLRQDHADQTVVELVLDADQGGGDLDQRRLIGLERALDDLP